MGITSRQVSQAAEQRAQLHINWLDYKFLILSGDLAIVLLSYYLAYRIREAVPLPFTQSLLPRERFGMVTHMWWLLLASQAAMLYFCGLYDQLERKGIKEISAGALSACSLQAVLLITVYYFRNDPVFPRSVLLIFLALNALTITCWRLTLKLLSRQPESRVLIVGSGDSVLQLITEIKRNRWMKKRIVGIVSDDSGTEGSVLGCPILGDKDRLVQLLNENDIDEVIIAPEVKWQDRLVDEISRLETTPARIFVIPSLYEILIGKIKHINIHDIPLIEVIKNPNDPVNMFVKRFFDLALSLSLLLLLLPVFAVCALLIKFDSPGPAFFCQQRVGKGGRIFKLYKFRTMIEGAEDETGAVLAKEDDPRLTRVGKVLRRFRLDELPQLFNVLKGEMSFVGPRPERPEFVREYERTIRGYSERHKMKPGITGLAQVRGFYHTSPENKLRYDLAYMYNYSPLLDIIIVLETVKTIFSRKSA